MSESVRHDWTTGDVLGIMQSPLLELVGRAWNVHCTHHPDNDIQLASLMSIKTGGCPEDCKYCPQSAHYKTEVTREESLDCAKVLAAAHRAQDQGATRFCMGAAWREVHDGPEFDSVLDMVRGVHDMGMEACVTLGMVNADQAQRLAEAGLTAYNHNLDTSPEFYGEIITTRTYEDRLKTLENVRKAGLQLCVGGIIGMGESAHDRARMLEILSHLDPHPESVPINTLVAVEGTPLAGQKPVDPLDLVRLCATARILMPAARVRLSAGRRQLSREAQILCFLAGANSIFYGEKLLTTSNRDCEEDLRLLRDIGLEALSPSTPQQADSEDDEAGATDAA